MPKKRVKKNLQKGKGDIYPDSSFRESRSKYLFPFSNGLHRGVQYYGLTSINIPELKSISEINQYNLKWCVELGSSQPQQAKTFGVEYHETKDVSIKKIIKIITKRPAFFRLKKQVLKRYMRKHNIASMEKLGLKVHKNCCKSRMSRRYASFSRFSPHYQEQPNPLYDQTKPISAENFPVELVPGSVPYQLRQALQEEINSGGIEALKQKYSIE